MAHELNWFTLRSLRMLQGNYYVAIFKPVLTGSGRMVTDGVYRHGAEMVALWFQHVMLLKPCVLCIYERCALFGVMGAGLVGAIAPKTPLRYVAMVI